MFDSGIGGLSVLNKALRHVKDAGFIYYADEDNTPYGLKTKEEVIAYSDNITNFLVKRGCEAVLIACNTASSCASGFLRKKYDIPNIAMEPAVKPALKGCPLENKRILVMATPLTLREEKLRNLIKREGGQERVDLLPMPKLVEFAERGIFFGDDVEGYLEKQLLTYDMEKYSSIVLGCTHFNYFERSIRKYAPSSIDIIDGREGTIRRMCDLCGIEYFDKKINVTYPDVKYYYSGRSVTDDRELERINKYHRQLEGFA